MRKDRITQRLEAFSGAVVPILLAALVAGLIEAALAVTHRLSNVDPVHYVPARIWVVLPLAWSALAALLALPAFVLWRRRGTLIVLAAMAALLTGCRMALFSRKWAVLVVIAVFLIGTFACMRIPLPRMRHATGWLLALLLLLAGGGVFAAFPHATEARARQAVAGPNILVVFADTLRYDAVFLPDGSVKPELPALRRFAGESVIYDSAYAASSWTLPSHLAAVTGLEAHELGLDFDHQTLERPALTLAERFRRRGYRTAAVVSNPFLHEASAFVRGFDSYEHPSRSLDLCRATPVILLAQIWPRVAGTVCGWSAGQVVERALRQMSEGEAPYLVVLNLMDAHEPSYLEPDCRKGAPARHNTLLRLQVREPGLYHAGVRCLDRSLGALFDRASASKRGTVVVFTSDHGEHLHERGLLGHGQTLYPEVLHVPLLIRTPEHLRARIRAPLSLVQLSPILTAGEWTSAPERAVISTLSHSAARGGGRSISVIRGSWQLITNEKGGEELIDLRSGNSVTESPLRGQLQADVAAVLRAWPRLPATDFRSLGYIH